MSSGVRLDPARISPAVLALMGPKDRARYAPAESLRLAPAAGSLVDTTAHLTVNAYAEEQRLQAEIIAWLKGEGYEPGFSRMDRKSTLPLGWPDIFFAAHNRLAVAFEIKTEAGRTSPEQDERMARMQAAGWTVQVVRSLEFAKDFLRQVETRI